VGRGLDRAMDGWIDRGIEGLRGKDRRMDKL
jgi:hypothetical protein